MLRRKERNPDQYEIKKKRLKIKRKKVNNLEKESIFPLQDKPSNFEGGWSSMSTPLTFYFVF